MTQYSLEYLAGFFDGEGCVTAHVSGRDRCLWYPRVAIGQHIRHRDVIDEFRRRWGGSSVFKRRGKEFVMWHANSRSVQGVLSDLLPHLRQKRLQAELALDMAGCVPDMNRTPRTASGDPVVRLRAYLGRAICGLNQGATSSA